MTAEERANLAWSAKVAVEDMKEAAKGSLHDRHGGGTSGGVTDDWKASVDRQLEQLHGDVRNLLLGLIGGFLILAGGGWAIYDKLSDRIATVGASTNALAVEQAKTNAKLDLLLERTAPPK